MDTKIDPPSLYPLLLDDGGRNLSKRPRQTNDCVVRALAIVTGEPYDLVYQELAKAGRKSHDGFDLHAYLRRRHAFMGHVFDCETCDHTMTIDGVLDAWGYERIVIETADHVMACIGGTIRDMIREPSIKRAYRVWVFPI